MPARPAAVVEYIRRTKGWNRRHYRIESRGPGVFAVAGGGQSVELQTDPVSHRVVKEVGGQ
jgi:hypothetical protein